ncbi:hypothetical protein DPMN_037524 [Dreissena polymorpha]|uniref:C2H2-type domain-containing protein n=1 Tax=Dreissena polymorpha TaxID=45954 RepID=A0A9D4MB56_DREPO|nr:hypothetical protein DPMN_037524 [Dreissena polymorpha]
MLCETRASKDSFIVVQPFPLEPAKDIVSMHAQNDYHQSRDRTNQSSQSYTTLRRMELTPTPSQSSESSADMHVLQTHPVYQTNVQSSAPILTVAPNERIVLPTNIEDQSLPFTRENYGKEKDKWILKRHICHYCGKRCLKPSDLTRHVKIHTGEYSYECPVCRAKFREKFGLAAHTRKGNCSPRM